MIAPILALLAFLAFGAAPATAQGCGPANPNCIVPTAPPGDSTNKAASTAFVQKNGAGASASVLANGAKCDGVTDDSAAFTAMSAAGGGYIIPVGLQCAIANTVTWSSNSTFVLGEGASFIWTGANGGTIFQSSASTTLTNFALAGPYPGGPTIFCNACGVALNLHSMQYSGFSNLNIYSTVATNTLWSVFANSSMGSGTPAANSFQNYFWDITQSGPAVGTVWSVGGSWNGSSVVNTFTGNNFHNINGGYYPGLGHGSINVCGFCIVSATDSNVVSGEFYFATGANNAVGVEFNSSTTPNSNVGVYNWNVQKLDVDCFSTFTGRVSLKINTAYHIVVGSLYSWNGTINPSCEGGGVGGMVLSASASYNLNYLDPSNKIFNYNNLMYYATPTFQGAYAIAGGTLYTASTLNSGVPCNSGSQGIFTYITDGATSPVYNATMVGGGSVKQPVFCNGTNWVNH